MKLIGKILLVILILAAGYFGYWRYDAQDRMHRVTAQGLAALEPDQLVTVVENDWIVFQPTGIAPTKGLIFYPGGECDERGYAETLRAIAAAGYLVVLVPMPLQLAVFAPNKADAVIAAYPDIQTWAIAGHSLGGSMAAAYVSDAPEKLTGLLLWDAYAANDLSQSNLAVRMIHRADAEGNPPEDYLSRLPLLPPQTEYVPLIGAQHLNFGRFKAGRLYRDEPPPELDPDTQRAMVAAASVMFMDQL